MADIFGAIAAAKESSAREPLVYPEPMKKSERSFPLSPCDATPAAVYEKMSTKRELDAEISRLRSKYAPFRRRMAPKIGDTRRRIDVSEFELSIDGEAPRRVRIPYYGGPVGKATAAYTATVSLSDIPDGRALFLHFDGADYLAEVYVNGQFVGMHEGFFGAFEFDVTKNVKKGENELKIILKNDFVYMGNAEPNAPDMRIEGDKLYAATGPGYDDPEWGWHHCPPGFGLYQAVYFEERPTYFISDIFVRPMIDTDEFEVWTTVYSTKTLPPERFSLSYSVYGWNFNEVAVESFTYEPMTFTNDAFGYSISEYDLIHRDGREDPRKLILFGGENTVRFKFKRVGMKRWTPDAPYLYEAQVTLSINGEKVETRANRFGMRSFVIDESDKIKGMPYLNGVPCRLRGANTMGFEQQDVMRGDFSQLEYDMLMAKACNMNFLRLTQRPVQHEIYELCDEIGLMIQTDLPLFAAMRRTKFAEGVRQADQIYWKIRLISVR